MRRERAGLWTNRYGPGSRARPGAALPHSGVETDIGFNFYEAINSTTTAKGVIQTPTNSPGGMFEIRQIRKPLIGYEITYSYNPAGETIAPTPAPSCGSNCNTPPQSLPSGGSTLGLDWVISHKFGALRPFAAGGLGFLFRRSLLWRHGGPNRRSEQHLRQQQR